MDNLDENKVDNSFELVTTKDQSNRQAENAAHNQTETYKEVLNVSSPHSIAVFLYCNLIEVF